jgi:uncharacterized damage-inducible protein DinB
MEIHSMSTFLPYWERIRERTQRVVDLIPPEKLEWTYRPGKFTPGDLVRHLATIERYMYAENAQFRPSLYPGCGPELASGYPAVMAYFKKLHEESIAIFRGVTDEDLQRKTLTPGGAELRLGKWLRAMVEHECHHRGQIYLYLNMLGISTPPLYGLTAEEVEARSGGPSE